MLRFRRRFDPLDEAQLRGAVKSEEEYAVLAALLQVPEKYRLVLVLHHVDGYTTQEIARIIGRTPSAVKMRLQKGRLLLKTAYGEE